MYILYLQLILIFTTFLIGFLISIPVGISKSDFNGSCLLYSSFSDHRNSLKSEDLRKSILSGAQLTCNFCIFSGSVSVLLAVLLLIGTFFVIYQQRIFCGSERLIELSPKWNSQKSSPRFPNRTPLISAWIHFYGSSCISILLFVTGCLVSTGFHSFCENGLKAAKKHLDSCIELEQYTGPFYTNLSIVQISCWIGTVTWMLLAIISRFRLKKLNFGKSSKTHSILQDGDSEELSVNTDNLRPDAK